jgi:hypothetical protein
MEEIDIEFTPEITDDITKDEIYKTTIDFIINYEDGIIDLSALKEIELAFVEEEFYYYAEAVKRALKAIKVIFI